MTKAEASVIRAAMRVFAVYEGDRFAKICHTRAEARDTIARWHRGYDWRVVPGVFVPSEVEAKRGTGRKRG